MEKSKVTLKYTSAIIAVVSQTLLLGVCHFLESLAPRQNPIPQSSLGKVRAKWGSLYGLQMYLIKKVKTHSFQNHKG